MGHFDSRVAITAELEPDEVADVVINLLQFKARQQVAIECDKLIEAIKLEERRDRARTSLQWIVDRLENRLPHDEDTEQFDRKLAILPVSDHAEWRDKLSKAQAEYSARIKRDLERMIIIARRRILSPREIAEFDELIDRLPDGERQDHINSMTAAIAARDATEANEIAQSNLVMGAAGNATQTERGDEENIPF